MKVGVCIICLLLSLKAYSSERDYQNMYCIGAMEVVMPDRSRADCVTETHAIEYDFASKWKEAVGQSLNYAMHTGKRAGIVLILEKKKDLRYLDQLNRLIKHYLLPIDVWVVPVS